MYSAEAVASHTTFLHVQVTPLNPSVLQRSYCSGQDSGGESGAGAGVASGPDGGACSAKGFADTVYNNTAATIKVCKIMLAVCASSV